MIGEIKTTYFARIALMIALMAGLTSCATVKGWFGRGDHGKPAVSAEAVAGDQKANAEAALRQIIGESVAAAEKDAKEDSGRIIRRSPYFYKEYVSYPEGPDGMKISMQETESRTRPYTADVKLDKVRFSTRLHRKRNEAASDTNFLRDTGEETLTYELRNGRWTRVGSVFIADKSEENINGQWVSVKEEEKRAMDEEEQPGWFKRTWSHILGRD